MEQSAEKPKHRGTIIVDSNVLYDLRAEVDRQFLHFRVSKRKYIDALTMLGQHGFDILIPEEAVFETTRHVVIKDGKTLRNVNPYIADENNKRECNYLVHFFKQCLEDKLPGVHILSSLQLPECQATGKIRSIRKVLQNHSRADSSAKKSIGNLIENNKLSNLSDKVIKKHIKRFSEYEDKNSTIYIASTDRNFEHSIENTYGLHENIKLLDTSGFLKALEESKVMTLIGINPEIPYQSMRNDISHKRSFGRYEPSCTPNGYVDSSCVAGNGWHGFINDAPFLAAMRELAHDLGIHAQNGAVGTNGLEAASHTSRLKGRNDQGVYVPHSSNNPMSF